MASTNYQYELVKLYLAAFLRAPERSGLNYWLTQLENGTPFDTLLETIFSLDIVKAVYPEGLPRDSFVTLIYVNVFGKSPDPEGLAYWSKQSDEGKTRGNLVIDMINAGLSSPDGTPGKAYIVNRMAVAQFAIDQQLTQRADLNPNYLKSVLLSVDSDNASVGVAKKALSSGVTRIGLGVPFGVTVVVDLQGTNAALNNTVELLLNRQSFSTPITKILSDADVKAKKITLTIPSSVNWGSDGSKLLSVFIKDSAGNSSLPGGDLLVDLNVGAPNAPSKSITIPVAANGINAIEKLAGILAKVDLSGTGALAGDKIELLIAGVSFSPSVLTVVTDADVRAGFVNALIPGTANWGVDGEKLLSARIIDLSGNVGGAGGAIAVTLDTIAPNAPTAVLAIAAAKDSLNLLERADPVQVIVDISGTDAKLGDALELLIDNKTFASSTLHLLTSAEIAAKKVTLMIAGADPAWGNDGLKAISARVIDFAGNIGKPGGTINVIVDSLSPSARDTLLAIPAAVNGINAIERDAGISVVISLIGAGVFANDVVHLLLDGFPFLPNIKQTITPAQIAAKAVTMTIPASVKMGTDGLKAISVSFTDTSGNTSFPSNRTTFTLDTVAPAAPTSPLIVPAGVNTFNAAEKMAGVSVIMKLDGTFALSGDTAEILIAGASFSTPVRQILTVDDILNGMVTVLIPGTSVWGLDGTKVLSARIMDIAGNIGKEGPTLDVIIDTAASFGPSVTLLVPANASGGISGVEKTAGVDVVVNLGGTTVTVGDKVEILIEGASFLVPVIHVLTELEIASKSATLTIGENDGWGVDGIKTLTARFVDFPGNIGTGSGATKVNLDGTAPNSSSATITASAALNGINLAEKNNGVDLIVNFNTSAAIPGDVLNILLDGLAFPIAVIQTITPAQALAKTASIRIPGNANWGNDGNRMLSARFTDSAGNVGSPGVGLIVQVDTVAPTAPSTSVAISAAINGINNAEKAAGVEVLINLIGTNAVAGDKLEILIDSKSFTTPIVQTLTSVDISNAFAISMIASNAIWGSDGVKIISIRLSDKAGNIGIPGGAELISLDTLAPAGPIKPLVVPANSGGGIGLGELSAGVNVVIDLNGALINVGDTLEVLIGGESFTAPSKHILTAAEITARSAIVAIAAGDGWGADGNKVLTARFTDTSGNTGTATGATTVTIDRTAPISNDITVAVSAAINGISLAEKMTGVDVIVNLSTINPLVGDVVTLFLDGNSFTTPISQTVNAAQVLTKTVNIKIPGNANWGIDGNHVLSANLADATGNVGAPGIGTLVMLDTTAPTAPSNQVAIAAASNGISNAERAAGINVLASLIGTGAAVGDKLEILIDTKQFATPVTQVLTSADIANAFVNIMIPGNAVWGVDGSKSIAVRITDVAGNLGAAGGALTVNIDTLPPAGPTKALAVPANAGGGISLSELNAGVSVILDLTGALVFAGESVELFIGGASFSTPAKHTLTAAELTAKSATILIAAADGWGADGSKILTARFTDLAGNTGPSGLPTTVTIDGTAPTSNGATLLVSAATNGISLGEKNVGVDVIVNLSATNVIGGDILNILIDGIPFPTAVSQTITAAQALAKTATIKIPGNAIWGTEGNHVLSASMTDSVGNLGASGIGLIVQLDTIAPTAPSNAVMIAAATNGINNAEKIAGISASFSLIGTNAMVGDKLEILLDAKPFSTPIFQILTSADITNAFANTMIPGSALWGTDGAKSISMRLIDVAGNVGAVGGALTVSLDTSAPIGPSKPLVVPANAGGGIGVGELNAGISVILDLTGALVLAGESVEILIGGASFSTPVKRVLTAAEITAKSATLVIAAGDGWGTDGNKILTARFTDLAGNVGSAGVATTVTLDGTAPTSSGATLTVAATTNGISLTEKNAGVDVVVNLSATNVIAGDILNILIDGAAFPTIVAQTITPAQALAKAATIKIPGSAIWGNEGSHVLSANLTDAAGNVGTPGVQFILQLDTVAPLAPSNAVLIAAATNGINSVEKTEGVTVLANLVGTGAVAGDKLEILIDTKSFATPITQVLTGADITNGFASTLIAAGFGWGADGNKSISVRITDVAGNIGAAGGALAVSLDTLASPGPGVGIAVAANGGGGITTAELIAGVVAVVNLLGTTAVAGDTVEILIGGAAFFTPVTHVLTAPEILAKSASLTIGVGDGWGGEGVKILTARFIDVAGNIGTATGTLSVNIDSVPPSIITSPLVVASALNGISDAERIAGVAVVVDLTGTAALAGDTVNLQIDGLAFPVAVTQMISAAQITAKSVTLTIPGNATWGLDGNHILTASIADALGNTSASGGALTVLLDTIGPTAPTNPASIAVAVNAISATEKLAGVVVLVNLVGSNAVAGDQVEVLVGAGPFPTAVTLTLTAADITNTFANVTIPGSAVWGADGSKVMSVRMLDSIGNIGGTSPTSTVQLDTVASAGPVNVLVVAANAGGGITPAEKLAGVNVDVNLFGTTALAGDSVEILIGGFAFAIPVIHVLTAAEILAQSVSLTIASGSGWGIDGNKILTARFIDIAGNVGIGAGNLTVNLDTTSPTASTAPLVVVAAANGISNTEKLAGVSVSVDLNGTSAVAGDIINLQIDGVSFPTPVAQTITAAQITAKSASIIIPGNAFWGADGNKVLTSNITDLLGNAGPLNGAITVFLDITAPNSALNPVAIAVATNGINAAEKAAGVSVDVDLRGLGTTNGDKIELLIDGLAFAVPVTKVLTAFDVGNQSVTIVIPNAAGWGADATKLISLRGIDVAGNLGTDSGALSVILDTSASAGPTNILIVNANGAGGITAAEKATGVIVDVDLTGTNVVAGDTVEIIIGGLPFTTPVKHILTAPEIAAKSASLTIASASGWGADGVKTLTARFIDIAGNIGSASGTLSVTLLDSTAPGTPSNSLSSVAANNGISASEKLAGVIVTGSLSSTNGVVGDIAELFINGSSFATPVTHVLTGPEVLAGSFNFTVANASGWGADGIKALTMSVTDVAGNVGSPGGSFNVTLDTLSPNAPSNAIVVAAAAGGINAGEKVAGVVAVVDLTGTNAVVNDKLEVLLGGSSFSTPVIRVLTNADILAGSASVTIDTSSGWGTDGTKTLSSRIVDIAGNNGLAGGSLTTILDTSIPAASGLPIYFDADNSGTKNLGDTFVFTITEATNKAITIANITFGNAHTFGVGASTAWSLDGTQLTVTLGAAPTVTTGDIVTLVGVSDAAGNSLNLAFSIF